LWFWCVLRAAAWCASRVRLRGFFWPGDPGSRRLPSAKSPPGAVVFVECYFRLNVFSRSSGALVRASGVFWRVSGAFWEFRCGSGTSCARAAAWCVSGLDPPPVPWSSKVFFVLDVLSRSSGAFSGAFGFGCVLGCFIVVLARPARTAAWWASLARLRGFSGLENPGAKSPLGAKSSPVPWSSNAFSC
jgi:hypothetical protein